MQGLDQAGASRRALDYLASRIDYERMLHIPYGLRDFKLDRMRGLLAMLGDPHLGLKVVHIAGTKGKGSTSAMTAAMLTAAGHRTGLYSSPHLERVEERIAVDGVPCTGEELATLVDQVRAAVSALDAKAATAEPPTGGPTYFEILTAIGFLYFRVRQVDLAVLEVGLGGRLDSTNVCQPVVTAITSISFDHMKQLGSTLQQIAAEKAGIIKPGVPVVSGVVCDEPQQVVAQTAREQGSDLIQLGRDFGYTYKPARIEAGRQAAGQIFFRGRIGDQLQQYFGLSLRPLGRHQATNAAVALACIAVLEQQGWRVPEAAKRAALGQVELPARIEIIGSRPTIVLDAAHNPASIEALVATLDVSFSSRRKLLIFGTTADKDMEGMLRALLPRFDEVVFTRYVKNPRAAEPEVLLRLAAETSTIPASICLDPAAALNRARAGLSADDLLVITGSFFLAAEMRPLLARVSVIDEPRGEL